MTDTQPSTERGSPSQDSDEDDHRIGGSDIANLLQSKGPVVRCVVLRVPRQDQDTTKESSILEDLVEELEIDTTPAKNEVEKVLGGPITFIGQYDEGEGIVLMALRGLVANTEDSEEYESMSVGRLRAKCKERNVNTDTMIEKQELVVALRDKPPLNPHRLQPPLHNVRIRGDILILKVAEVDDESLDEDDAKDVVDEGKVDDETGHGETQEKEGDELSKRCDSGDFFLSYSKQEYLKFAARTDIVAQQPPNSEDVDGNGIDNEDSNSDNGDKEEDDDGDGDFQPGEDMDEMTEEEEKSAMLNIVMSELLRKFRRDNGRGAASREVLEIRASVAEQIGIEVVTYNESQQATEENRGEESGQKRSTGGREIENGEPARKKVKFNGNETAVEDEQGADNCPSVASKGRQEDQEKNG